ncbi:hypothetical protein AXW37_06425 [Yersinia ruckeri]|uniref:prophage tail fiber N-terminal domain-containing protein n=1 Tax=Yersinia ruckeri TaxID=29486 RepID=UPI0008FD3B64|nr:prophage tail fiber N-terminal domain-containing protein [Yersinia ruckeri]MCW6524292.1 prophage tail fiber N-terminal domain-containing protein [Yersinia ruckeri]MCW6604785.1 prophage tail fiber N-terminal domain-containing protein [Yersinia ruckeri]MDN0091711.1 prophage tail fiber N-terminal domain-containing protein [Yersinia ruckeri]OIX46816.1 hypothetical protein AXW22_06190 [Yersinia ruckeri]OJB71500.1 hypothetical protein A9Q65_06165 [Yersinia ruckeri]
MSILVSGVLMDPLGRPIPAAQITLTAIANSLSVLNGLSATVETDSVGRYGITLAMGSYAISIAAEGRNHVYGAITLDETTGPSTLNQLLKQQMMESEVTPDVILYFRQIQQQVANDLSTMTVMESHVTGAASSAAESEAAAKGYAANLANAVATARHYRDQATDRLILPMKGPPVRRLANRRRQTVSRKPPFPKTIRENTEIAPNRLPPLQRIALQLWPPNRPPIKLKYRLKSMPIGQS